MLFPEEDAPLLKAWIVKRIEDTSDADAEVLAEYIIALLKHDGSKEDVRKLCEAEIPDFLTEDPKAFLDDVFQTIVYKSYVPGAPPPPKLPPSAQQPPPRPPTNDAAGANEPTAPPSRKRGYRDFDAPGGQEAQSQIDQRPMKNPRRNGQWQGELPQPPEFPMVMPPFDPENPMAAFMNIGMAYPGMQQFVAQRGRGGRQKRRGRCRDFDNKGYCARGANCVYEHGPDLGYMMGMEGLPLNEGQDPYDPGRTRGSSNNYGANGFAESTRGRGGRRGGRVGKRGGARAPFSADGPVQDRSKTTIVVENIPEENFDEDQVRGFFSQFGTILEVSMRPYKHLAIVKFDKWGAANAAYRSPKVIFDNRFVKVFWYKGEGESNTPNNGVKAGGDQPSEEMDVEPEMDPEEFQRRQEEAQRRHQERENRRMELEKQRQELEKRQQELMERHRAEAERLKSKQQEKNGAGAINGGDGETSGKDMLRAKLAALEQEAKILGIDPDAASEDAGSPFAPRGGWRGGRGSFRARGGRGSWRGGRGGLEGVGARHAAYAQYSIDNRPKKIAITGADFSVPEKDESLRHFLLNLGEFESVEPSATTTYVSFRDRKTAERMYYGLHGKELPGVEGKLDLAWVNGAPPAAAASAAPSSATGKEEGEVDAMDEDSGGHQEQDNGAEVETEYRVEDEDAY